MNSLDTATTDPVILRRAFSCFPSGVTALGALIAGEPRCIIASTFGEDHGLWQRLGLTVGDVWIIAAAVFLVSRPTTTEHASLDGPL